MQTVQDIAAEIVTREGGYVNDPDDPGGATNHGVTIHTMRRLGLDLTGDGQVTTADVRVLKRNQAIEIFVQHYFEKPNIDALPEQLQATVFDMYVNSGSNSVNILQRLFKMLQLELQVDGVIGPRTIAAAESAFRLAPDHLADAYGIERRKYYYALADRRPASRKYARRRDGGKGGWITRAEAFISPRFHLTAGAHQKRISAWG